MLVYGAFNWDRPTYVRSKEWSPRFGSEILGGKFSGVPALVFVWFLCALVIILP